MLIEDTPDVTPEPTSYAPSHPDTEKIQCYECGADAWKKKVPGDAWDHFCRECRSGAIVLQRQVNYGSDWQRVRQWVLNRDNRQCRRCEQRGDLHVHHIEKIIWFETTKEAHQPENLITLCEGCHSELENKPDACRELLDHIVRV